MFVKGEQQSGNSNLHVLKQHTYEKVCQGFLSKGGEGYFQSQILVFESTCR